MQIKLKNPDIKKIHFRARTMQEINKVKHKLEEMGYKIMFLKIKEKK